MRPPRVPTNADLDNPDYCTYAASYYRNEAVLALQRKRPFFVTAAKHHLRVSRGWDARYDEIMRAKERTRTGHIE